jgi:hypothetical protein
MVVLVACSSVSLGGCLSDRDAATRGKHFQTPAARYGVTIAAPAYLTGLVTGEHDMQNEPVTVRCATCHALLSKRPALPTSAAGAAGPHAQLRLQHGELHCAACHDGVAVDSLRLADGRALALVDAIELCSQCHGPQARDYRHGAHGGMRGYWDLSRGPRQRNTCVSCHDPHEPAYPSYRPAPPPNDRFAEGAARHE